MAPTDKLEEVSLSGLSLEPLPDPNLLNYQPPKATLAEKGGAKALPRPSSTTDRRVGKERRLTLRFGDDRRSGTDRRPRFKGFDPGKID
jgi:hypothetical protein